MLSTFQGRQAASRQKGVRLLPACFHAYSQLATWIATNRTGPSPERLGMVLTVLYGQPFKIVWRRSGVLGGTLSVLALCLV